MEFFSNILTKQICQDIISNTGEIYFVGGCVRDFFLQKKPKDIDIVVRGLEYNHLFSILKKYGKVDVVGESFGVIKFKEFETNFELEIALSRVDIKDETSKGHKAIIAQSDPFLSIEEDLFRRDFTINSIAIDSNLNFIDPFGGIDDIKNKVIKATNEQTFNDDPLRMLRAISQAARFDFQIEEGTKLLLVDNSEKIKEITPERILMEFQKVFDKKGNVVAFLHNLIYSGLYENIFGFRFIKPSLAVEDVNTLAELLFYCFTSAKIENNYSPFAKNIEDISLYLQKTLKIDNELSKQIKALERSYRYGFQYFTATEKNILAFSILQIYPKAYELKLLKDLFEEFMVKNYPKSYNELALTGNQLIDELDIPEGPMIGNIRRALLETILRDNITNTYEECFKFAYNYKKLNVKADY